MIDIRKVLFFIFMGWDLGPSFGADCRPNQSNLEYVTGRGEASDFPEAKSSALADLASFFGVDVGAESHVLDTSLSNNVDIMTNIKVTVRGVVKGAEILSECSGGPGVSLILGIRKSTLVALINQRSEQRLAWLSANLGMEKGGVVGGKRLQTLKSVLGEERADREMWTLLNQPQTMFKSIPKDQKILILNAIAKTVDRVKSYRLKASDELAERTLVAAARALEAKGISVSIDAKEKEYQLVWSCRISQGVSVGKNIRFSVTCGLLGSDFDFPEIRSDGITTVGNVEETASMMVVESLGMTGKGL